MLFRSGESKSRVTRSVRFGGGKWQILFYPNSGEGNFVSLYLNCEPTQEEKDSAMNGKWVRDGLFKFSFELRNTTKSTLFNMKEACDHTFSYRTQNWGWAQFSKRDHVYYSSSAVRQADSFVVICTITSSPTAPVTPSRIKKRLVPTAMLDVVGSLLDDPTYSDIEFVFPDKTRTTTEGSTGRFPRRKRPSRRIWACKRLLTRADYFNSMFNSGFSETSASMISSNMGVHSPVASDAETTSGFDHLHEDSDLDEEAAEAAASLDIADEDDDGGEEDMFESEEFRTPLDEHSHLHKSPVLHRKPSIGAGGGSALMVTTNEAEPTDAMMEDQDRDQEVASDRDAREDASPTRSMTLGESSSRLGLRDVMRDESPGTVIVRSMRSERSPPVPGPPKVRVVVNDVAYTTYRAVLYYLYTDTIVFAPLASSFLHKTKRHLRSQSQRVTADLPVDNQRDGEESMSSVRPTLSRRTTAMHSQSHANASEGMNSGSGAGQAQAAATGHPTTRAQWIKNWAVDYPGRPVPCSAKAVYRLADKLDLAELKERARDHIVKSLTITNVPHEVFSLFSATFEEIRKVQMDFFLANWGEIRGSESMAGVWTQIRTGRHPGFEEVWPLIAQNLEYRATMAEGAVGDGEREMHVES